MDEPTCPCGAGRPYGECCGRLHAGTTTAPTAEALMRSRYSAFACGEADYLRRTWHDSTRPEELVLDPTIHWTRLRILDVLAGGKTDDTGIVEFRAHYRVGDEPHVLHERSTFERVDGTWRYVTGEVR